MQQKAAHAIVLCGANGGIGGPGLGQPRWRHLAPGLPHDRAAVPDPIRAVLGARPGTGAFWAEGGCQTVDTNPPLSVCDMAHLPFLPFSASKGHASRRHNWAVPQRLA